MPINRNIDIREIAWPICVLNCKKEVSRLKKGEQIEVLVKDIDVVNNLVTLMEQLLGHKIEKLKENNHYRLIIKKDNGN
ncbi:sulfurtransferase TusA family protein [Desulfobacula sp.]